MELVEGLFACRSLGVRVHQGAVTQGRGVRRSCAPCPDTKRTESRLRRGATRMVGRESLLIERILSCWNTVKDDSRCQTLAVVGDAGVGKTRLVLELSSRPEFVDATLLQVQCHEIFASTPLYPIGAYSLGTRRTDRRRRRARPLRQDFELSRGTGPQHSGKPRPRREPARHGCTRRQHVRSPTPQLLKRAQCEFIVSVVEQAARARPVILWVEDAHWLDPSSAELLQDIVTASAQLPAAGGADDAAVSQGTCASPEIDETIHLEHLGVERLPRAGAVCSWRRCAVRRDDLRRPSPRPTACRSFSSNSSFPSSKSSRKDRRRTGGWAACRSCSPN